MAYELVLLPILSDIYPALNISVPCWCTLDESHMISGDFVELGTVWSFEEGPIAILKR